MSATPASPEEGPVPEISTISREKEKLNLHPREAIVPPGRGSVFGRGFFRLFFSMSATGVLVFPALLAIGAGVFLFGLAGTAGPYEEGLRASYSPRIFPYSMGIGAVFFLLVLRALQVELNRHWKKPGQEGEGKEPWTWDYPWSTSWMLPDGEHVESSPLGKVTFFAVVALCNTLWFAGEPFFYIFLPFLDLIALAVLVAILRKGVQSVRFRRPVVIWEAIPVHPDGMLQGRIAFPRDVRPTGPTRLTLRCVKEERGDFDEAYAIYRETREIPLPGEPGEPLDVLSFAFKVPRNLPGNSLHTRAPDYWQVAVEVPVAGPDLEVAFLAPVYPKRS